MIDEWQEAPAIWDAARAKVDEISENGLFILTGSSTPKYKGVLHSGAGKISRLKMNTMSLLWIGICIWHSFATKIMYWKL
ncbi:AAA family ATPase [Mycoplasmopsis agalactiae]|uniref:AAA family ATPase n=1 Tax=Mycoplasmopsis agalactiae TaxID=2110 RepID=UPI001F3A3212|nr:AAA family ATPase [Mycoplasmopsis agalactiae]